MAAIQETLSLVDHFTAPFSRFINMARQAAGFSSAAQRAAMEMGQSQRAAAETAQSAYREAEAAAQSSQASMDALGRRLSELNSKAEASRQAMARLADAGQAGGREYAALERRVRGLSGAIEETGARYDAASQRAEAAASAIQRTAQQAAEASRAFASSMETVSSGTFAGKAERAQAYIQELLSVQSQLQRTNVELNIHQRMLSAVSAAQGAASSDAVELTGRLSGLASETMSLKNRQTALRSALEQAAGGSRKADAAIRQYQKTASNAASSTNALVTQVKRLAGAYLSIQGVKALVGQADTMSQITARLNMMNDGNQSTEELSNMIFQSAQRSRGSYADTASFVAKLGTLAGDAFSSNAELIAFSEQINKQMTLSGTSSAEAQGAMLQLTQAIASGVLRGEELNSVMEQTPMIAQTIAKYLGVSTGEMRELASQGAITAQVVKSAMLSAAGETNAAFANMPVTWANLATAAQNILLGGFRPLLDVVSSIPQAIVDNSDVVIAALLGVGAVLAVIGTIAMISGVKTAAAFLLPYWPLLALGLAASAFAYGMLEAGTTSMDILGMVGEGFGWLYALVGNVVVNLYNLWASFAEFFANVFDHPLQAAGNLFFDFIDSILGLLQTAAGAIDAVFGSSLAGTVSGWRSSLDRWVNDAIGPNEIQVKRMEQIDFAASMAGGREIGEKIGGAISDFGNTMNAPGNYPLDGIDNKLSGISKNVGNIAKSVSMSEEDIKSLVDVAERRYVNNINLTAQSPVINVSGQNTGNSQQDRKALADTIRDILIEQTAAGSTRATARV